MIEHKIGDLFSNTEGYIVHGCNAQGVMGSGVAKIVKDRYFEAFKLYAMCLQSKREKNESALGTNTYHLENRNFIIVNAVTQEYYGSDGGQYTDYDAVRSCFKDIIEETERWDKIFKDVPKVINFPLIGCDRGGGDWDIVAAIIDEEIDDSFKKILWTLK